MRARLHHLVVDADDPRACAVFWSALLDQPVTYDSDDFVVVAADSHHSGLAFQRAPGHQRPTWPEPGVPQQLHLDVMVEDVDAAHEWVIGLGATPLPGGDAVYADPAGHPFCLIRRPTWAPPLESAAEVSA
jgi:catechol 2,3-dioxygenase-like lactoylglutathione lyase family enzyme